MKRVLLLATVAFLAPGIACADGLSGSWKFSGAAQGGATTLTCTLTQSGAKIAGSCVNAQGSTVDVSGTVTGSQVDFGYDVAGSPLHVDFKGEIQPDGSIKGTVSASTPGRPFTGTKQ